MATNRQDTLDPALLRPGRLDRKIEFPLPSRRERRLIFQTVTGKMNLSPDVDLEDCERCALVFALFTDSLVICSDVSRPDRLSSAEISSVVQAAGLQGILPSVSPLRTD
jgi:26S proteasome regulatory subunit T3